MALLFSHVQEWFYVRQIARLSGGGLGAVQRELQNLTQAGILLRRRHGNQVYYRANDNCSIFEELKHIMLKGAGLRDILISALAPMADRILLAFVFGSLARGEAELDSDIDLLVVGEVNSKDVIMAVLSAQEKLGREINPVVYPVHEFEAKIITGGHFIERVISGPKMFIIGTEDELKRLAEQRLAR